MSTIKVRRLSDSWDTHFGGGLNDYAEDIDAVAQIIRTRLLFFKGEWWEDQNLGIPMWQSALGTRSSSKVVVDSIVFESIKNTPYVNRVLNFESAVLNREYSCSVDVETEFGTLTVTNGGS